MQNLLQDSSGKLCTAKIVFVTTCVAVLGKYVLGGLYGIPTFDPSAAVALLGTTGAVYYGRNHTKDKK